MTNQYALGYKAGLDAAVKVCRDYAENFDWDLCCKSAIEGAIETIAALPVPEVQWRDLTDQEIVALERELVNRAMLRLADQEAAPVQLVKQKPVAYMVKSEGFIYSLVNRISAAEEIVSMLRKDDQGAAIHPLYAAPVDAKAIRAEALEEAAKMAEAYVARSIGIEMAAAIRGLKEES